LRNDNNRLASRTCS